MKKNTDFILDLHLLGANELIDGSVLPFTDLKRYINTWSMILYASWQGIECDIWTHEHIIPVIWAVVEA